MTNKGYRHLIYNQRCQIFALLKSKKYYSREKIAEIIESTQSTVSREIKRNADENGHYCPDRAQAKAEGRRSEASSSNTKLTPGIKAYIDMRLTKYYWSPEQISGRDMEAQCGVKLSHERIYQYILEDKEAGGTLYKCLRRSGRKYKKRGQKTGVRGTIPNRIGIEERPEIVEEKSRVGDFEVDTIVGANHKGAILSIVDRKTKLTFLKLLPNATAELTKTAMVEALQPLQEQVFTITSDNGKEFTQHQAVANDLGAGFYFANPYRACERGLNENTNGLVRQFFPKGSSFLGISQVDVDRAELLLNSRPRKTLGFKTPSEAFFEETGKVLGATTLVASVSVKAQVIIINI